MDVRFDVPGEPLAKGRGRVGMNRATGRAVVFTDAKTRKGEAAIRLFASEAMGTRRPFDGPLVLEVIAYRAKGLPKPGKRGPGQKLLDMLAHLIVPVSRPDGDNYLKAVCDGCNGILWADDAQVVDKTVRKRYSDRPRIAISVREYDWRRDNGQS